MSTASKRRARREAREVHAPTADSRSAVAVPPLSVWRWRTFPVFAALAFGAFLGANVAGITVAASPGNLGIVLIAFAIPMGFALSRLMTRFMMTRGWVRPRPRSRP